MGSDELEILNLNEAFYDAFRGRDFERMEEIWATEQKVAVIHPGWPPLYGREAVMQSWEGILDSPSSPEIICGESHAHIMGDTAFVICTEQVSNGELVATNIFAREDGTWKMVHHQASPIPPSADNEYTDMIH